MSSESSVIRVEGLGKRYLIGHRREERYHTLRDTLTNGVRNMGRRLIHPLLASSGQPMLGEGESEEFWALKDISFEVKQGDRVGIIGRNGAGKSTLLKILSRITEPTSGRVSIKGRVASLLEVGTGFHPELTGRENIYLNGAILGMSKADIRRRFDEIVAFSGVEKFLDTPVKRYSSGMYVRLAFAVAAHLEPEILVVDEVLAVGDAEFQRKCIGKMQDVSGHGRTVLFVSHNMGAIRQLCSCGIVLTQGGLGFSGSASEAVDFYTRSWKDRLDIHQLTVNSSHRRYMYMLEVEIVEAKFELARSKNQYSSDENIGILISIKGNKKVENFRISGSICDAEENRVGSFFSPESLSVKEGESLTILLRIINHNLARGVYGLNLSVGKGGLKSGHKDFDIVYDLLQFQVTEGHHGEQISNWNNSWGRINFPCEISSVN